jgi:sugar phosphate isomerase/epimerase
VGLWREPVQEFGPEAAARLVRSHGLRVSSLCRGGFLTAAEPAARRDALHDNRRAVDEAATLGARCLVLVVGGLPDGARDLDGARHRVLDGLRALAPYAGERGVRLALEALHPMFAADRSVLSSLGQALDWAEEFPAGQVGVVVDAYHQWWDPALTEGLLRARDRIAAYQVCDWVLPLGPDVLLSRGLMGTGSIDLPGLTLAVDAVGYDGDIEVEIFNQGLWDLPAPEAFALVIDAYLSCLPPAGSTDPGVPAAPAASRASVAGLPDAAAAGGS